MMNASGAMIVVPPSARRGGTRRGFRHVVVAGEDRTLCGRSAEWWQLELPRGGSGFQPETIGCKACRKTFARRGL